MFDLTDLDDRGRASTADGGRRPCKPKPFTRFRQMVLLTGHILSSLLKEPFDPFLVVEGLNLFESPTQHGLRDAVQLLVGSPLAMRRG